MSVLRFRKARGCVLTSNSVTSSDWLIESRFFFPEAVRIEASIAREDWAECGWFQMLLTDGFLPSAMKPHMIKVLPGSKESQGMDGVGSHEMMVVGPGWIHRVSSHYSVLFCVC